MPTRRNLYTGAAPANPVAFITPVMAGKRAMHMIGGAAEATAGLLSVSRRNLAPAGKAALGTVRGAPIITPAYATFAGIKDAIDTGVPEADTMTLMALFRRLPGTAWPSASLGIAPVAVSNLEVGTDGKTRGVGIWIAWTSTTQGALRAGGSYMDTAATPAPAQVVNSISLGTALDTWRIAALVITPTKPTTYDLTLGTSLGTATPATTTRAMNAGRNLLVGGAHNTYGGNADVALTQGWNTALSAADLRLEALKMQAIAAARGITVAVA